MNGSVYERVLGRDPELLMPELREYFSGTSWAGSAGSRFRQHVDVRLRTAFIGEWFRYAGNLTYKRQTP